jgi:hypothetical protein
LAHWRDFFLERLEKYSGHKVESDDDSLTVTCDNEDSFAVSIYETDGGFQVSFDGWHEEFDELATAQDCFAFGLSPKCRLKVTLRGNMEHKWTVQSEKPDGWADDTTTGLLFFPIWQSKRLEYRQNVLPLKT